jgi:hypothetical protein
MLTKRNLILICVGAGLCTLAYVVLSLGELRSYRNSLRTKVQLEKELAELPIPSGVTVGHHSSIAKSTSGLVGNSYEGNLTYEQVRAHYDRELAQRGWVFREQHPLTRWGENVGQSETIYCRGNQSANIFWTGNEQAAAGFRYGLDLGWGNDHCN